MHTSAWAHKNIIHTCTKTTCQWLHLVCFCQPSLPSYTLDVSLLCWGTGAEEKAGRLDTELLLQSSHTDTLCTVGKHIYRTVRERQDWHCLKQRPCVESLLKWTLQNIWWNILGINYKLSTLNDYDYYWLRSIHLLFKVNQMTYIFMQLFASMLDIQYCLCQVPCSEVINYHLDCLPNF